MNKDDLVEVVMEEAGLDTKAAGQRAVNAIFTAITNALSKGEEINVPGFGKFMVSKRKARQGVNPKTGAKIQIAATTVPKFKAGKALKDAVR